MHAVALTHDNKILTWGVNDQGALGRDTAWDGGLRDLDDDGSDSDDDDEDTGINPHESTPTAVSDEHFAEGTKFVQVTASDSATFALTEDGRVYGWGTFRSSDGILGFTETIKVQTTPMLLPTLKNIKALATGSNHVLALDHKGNVVAWGCGQQNQLGRRIIERNKMSSLIPQGIGLPRGKIAHVACGSYHSFAIDKDGQVYGWGLNNFGEVGIESSNAGEDAAVILKPAKLPAFEDHKIAQIDGGEHHSLACSEKGELFTWGRVDGYQVGFEFDKLTEDNTIYDERKDPRILFKPIVHEGVKNIVSVAAGTDNSFAVTRDGKVYSWGFSSNYQTGQGTIDDIHTPTLIDNTAIREKHIIGAGAGGQFSVLTGKSDDKPTANGS
jgi:regulator of chromosome condensation